MKQRLDRLLVDNDLARSRHQAQGLIMSGQVWVDGVRRDKPGFFASQTADIQVELPPRYVSRAGDKLAAANQKFGLDFTDKIVLDVGASTGGFTDYALQNGAERVYAVDVGTHQLHEKLRGHERVVLMEKTDIRQLSSEQNQSQFWVPGFPFQFAPADMAMVDVSFISLRQVLLPVVEVLQPGAPIIAMCKPQFEAGAREATKHKGVIKNDRLRRDILKQFEAWLAQNGLFVRDKADSEVTGAKGNVERFYLLVKARGQKQSSS
jgi:23S rRNA (cytidine1920-2'-O)/16S rRNA (cytidine1409-2'-O)-methyltransferase